MDSDGHTFYLTYPQSNQFTGKSVNIDWPSILTMRGYSHYKYNWTGLFYKNIAFQPMETPIFHTSCWLFAQKC